MEATYRERKRYTESEKNAEYGELERHIRKEKRDTERCRGMKRDMERREI